MNKLEAKHWHYRIVRHESGNLSLCEVYYAEDGTIIDIVTEPVFAAYSAGGETRDDIIKALRNALRDARTKPVLDIDEHRLD